MVIDFKAYVETKNAQQVALEATREAEAANRRRLERVLTDLLADLLAA